MLYVKDQISHMPSKNTIREFAPGSYYHVFNRGVEKRVIFLDDQDYVTFLGLIKKYLAGENHNKNNRHKYKTLSGDVKLLAYCLMPNHFHLLIYQDSPDAISEFMHRVVTGYVMYFNKRYGRVGGLFQGRYKASLINADSYLQHISRYIHLNPEDYESWQYSSLDYYKDKKHASWVDVEPILSLFNHNRKDYLDFVADYVDAKKELDILKHQLADDI